MHSKRSRLALIGILTLAVSVVVGMTIGGSAVAAKKKGGGSSKLTLNVKGGAIPDATISTAGDGGGSVGILNACKKVGSKKQAKIKELEIELAISHNDISDLFVQATGPKGLIVLFSGFENIAPGTPTSPPFFSLGVLGPTTFSDKAALAIDDGASTADPPPGNAFGAEAFAPYAGSFRPDDGTLKSLGGSTSGSWCIVVFDNDPFDPSGGDTPDVGSVTSAKFKFKTKG